MVIQCESCKRQYRLDDSRIKPPGSSVRCSKCGHIFFVSKADDSHFEDKFGLSQETPLFEDLKEENTSEKERTEYHEKQEDIFEASSDLAQGELGIVKEVIDEEVVDNENVINNNEETDNDVLDIPTEHQENLEDLIEVYIAENTATNLLSEELPTKENEEIEKKVEIPDIEETDDSIQNPPELFESEESIDNELDDNEVHDEVYPDKNIEEDYDDELSLENIDSISIEEETPDEEIAIIEDIDQENLEEAENEIPHNASRGKIIKSHTGIIPRFFYSLITIAALFVIFIASLIILIKAEILPEGTLSTLTTFVESVIPLGLNEQETPMVIISEHKARWMNTVNGPVYIVSGLITNESQAPVHYVKLRSEYIAAEQKEFEDTFYAGNTFTDVELKVSPIKNILSKLDQKNGDIDITNSRKLAGLNYNIQPGESIPFFTVYPAETRTLGLKYNLEVIDYKEAPSN